MVQFRYIVTGTGRSGTVALATVLTSVGIPCSHERFFNGSSLEKPIRLMKSLGGENSLCSHYSGLPRQQDRVVAESSYMAVPYLDAPCFAATTVIHAVRNPWKVILSFLNNIQFFRGEPEHEHERFVYAVLPQLHDINNPVDRAVYYYIHWNRIIETLTLKRGREQYIFHRIEDGPEVLLRKLGISEDLIKRTQKNDEVNIFKKWPGELRDLAPAQRVRIEQINASNYVAELLRVAKRYGYEGEWAEESPRKAVFTAGLEEGRCEGRFARIPRILEAGYRGYNLVRWRADCYALPQGENIDLEAVPESELKEHVDRYYVVVARRLSELKQKLDELSNNRVQGAGRGLPLLLESGYRCYNLVLWGRDYYALHQQSLSNLALETARAQVLRKFRNQGTLLIAESLREAREKVDWIVGQYPELENGKPFRNFADTGKDCEINGFRTLLRRVLHRCGLARSVRADSKIPV